MRQRCPSVPCPMSPRALISSRLHVVAPSFASLSGSQGGSPARTLTCLVVQALWSRWLFSSTAVICEMADDLDARMRTLSRHTGGEFEAGQLGHRNGQAPNGCESSPLPPPGHPRRRCPLDLLPLHPQLPLWFSAVPPWSTRSAPCSEVVVGLSA